MFAEGVSIGAPPDSFFAEGQVWKIPPMLPDRMREDQFRYLRQSLATSMKPADLLRLDHVMFMQRLYWVPEGMAAGMGVYVAYPAEEISAVVRLESHRSECEIVGEDLGTVTDEVRALMDRGGLRRMFVLDLALNSLEADPSSFVPEGAVASLNTHDMPPFAARIHGDDIQNPATTEPQPSQVSPALEPALLQLGISPARFVVVSVDDLLGVRESQNVPGSTTERPNWRRRSPLAVEALASDDAVREILLALDAARQSAPGEDG
jgi:4-alpha-glucanotransferase